MGYNKSELLSLPVKDKLELAEALWGSIEDEMLPTNEDLAFAEERLKLHNATPDEGVNIDLFKKYFEEQYGF